MILSSNKRYWTFQKLNWNWTLQLLNRNDDLASMWLLKFLPATHFQYSFDMISDLHQQWVNLNRQRYILHQLKLILDIGIENLLNFLQSWKDFESFELWLKWHSTWSFKTHLMLDWSLKVNPFELVVMVYVSKITELW